MPGFRPGRGKRPLPNPLGRPRKRVFGPVWTALYALIAMSAWLVWRVQPRLGLPLGLWLMQLGLDALWPWLFFGLERPGLAAIDIVVLLGITVATMLRFRRVSRIAVLLLLPYALWVGYATALNMAIWRQNA